MTRISRIFCILLVFALWVPGPAVAAPAHAAEASEAQQLKADFQDFLSVYIRKMEEKDTDFLARVHPELPGELYDFFFDATQAMMRHAQKNGLPPDIACKDYGVCTATWPQPGDSWAAQSFIRHEGTWRWLSE